MIRTRLLGTAMILGLSSVLAATADPIRITTIEVETELSAMEYNALDYWPEIETDLRNSLAEKVADFPGEEPYEVNVSLEVVSLSGSGLLTGAGEFNHMRGWVRAHPEGNPMAQHAFLVEVVATTETPTFIVPDPMAQVIVIPPAEGEFYDAMIDAFAAEAAAQLAQIDSAGPVPGMTDGGATAPAMEEPVEEEPVEDTDEMPETDLEVDPDADIDAGADAEVDAEADAGADDASDADGTDDGADDGGDDSESESGN
jgi:hypothetical protein